MPNYYEMSAYELEQERDRLQANMMKSDDDDEIERLDEAINEIDDILDSRDPELWD